MAQQDIQVSVPIVGIDPSKPVAYAAQVYDEESEEYLGGIVKRIKDQDHAISLLDGHDVIVVADHTAVASPDAQKIYRQPNDASNPTAYTDWMYQNNAWKAIATYTFPGIDNVPTAGSNNLVKSGGVHAAMATLAQGKQDVIEDLDEIREGAEAGAESLSGFTIAKQSGQTSVRLAEISSGGNQQVYLEGNDDISFSSGDNNTVVVGLGNNAARSGAIGYFTCDTAAATAAKTVSSSNYALSVGGSIKIKMTNANTAASGVTLKIGSAEAKPLYYAGQAVSASNTWQAGETVEVYYDGTNYQANNVAGGGGSGDGVYDISAAHSGTAYADLAAALGTNGANVPANVRQGGMSVEFVNSETLKYEQWRYMGTSVLDVDFVVVGNWQGVDDKPTDGSNNLVKSGGVYSRLNENKIVFDDDSEADLNIGDDEGNVIVEFSGGHIKTKNFDSRNGGSGNANVEATDDDSEADLNFSDDEGNVILQLKGGHIKTKNFDSRNGGGGGGEPSVDTKTVDLIMFMGQSNMAGRGRTSATWPATAPTLIDGAAYEFRAVTDPTMLYPVREPFGKDENRGAINDPHKTGSMVTAFCNSYYTKCKVPIVAVSASMGGTSSAGWLPNRGLLTEAIARLNEAVGYLLENDYTIAHKYMVWCQGESDGNANVSGETYISNFTQIFNAMKAQGIEKCFVVRIGKINVDPYTKYNAIIQAQTDMCKNSDDLILVSTEFASFQSIGLMPDSYHYYQEGYNRVGQHSGANAAEYRMYGKAPILYDSMTDSLYYSKNTF